MAFDSLLAGIRRRLRPNLPKFPPDANWFVDRWTYHGGRFRASGWVAMPDATMSAITICDKISRRPLENTNLSISMGLPSPDVQRHFGDFGKNCRFELHADVKNSDDVLRSALSVQMSNGDVVFIDDVAARKFLLDPYHQTRRDFFEMVGRDFPEGRILELGSRARSGNVIRGLLANTATYIGTDIMPGPNVDVVADAHELSRHFEPNSIDAIFSVSVFEHLLMPWKVVLEVNKVLKPGGLILIMAPQSFPPHDQPWDFWRFSDQAWHGLFNQYTGFQVLKTAMGEPLEMVADILTPVTQGFAMAPGFAGSAAICKKISETSLTWPANLDDIVKTAYPH
jgi:hypothetical protein